MLSNIVLEGLAAGKNILKKKQPLSRKMPEAIITSCGWRCWKEMNQRYSQGLPASGTQFTELHLEKWVAHCDEGSER